MLLGLVVSTVVSTFIALALAWSVAALSLVPYTALSYFFVKRTDVADVFVGVVGSLFFVATPTLLLLFAFMAIGGAPESIPLMAYAGVPVLYGGAGIGVFFLNERTKRLADAHHSEG